uniref:threonine--tRNA ligase n=1 Tax=Magallana gigas TaxID=29159 RepID=A0A8W8HP80_MAGGI
MVPPPEFIAYREKLWQELKADYDKWLAAQPQDPIKVTLPDGKQVEGQAWKTTPYDVAKGISQGLADNTVVAKVDGELWDLDRPFEKDSSLQLLKFDDKDGQYVFWHSSAHILGEAMEKLYGGHLCYGPPIEEGFYYDMWCESAAVSSNDFGSIEDKVKGIVKENLFQFDVEKEKFALKPMNCPGHCLMFDHRQRSWRELPLRMADFGVLHRNELSGALSGLTRVRRFQQDDAHIFCQPEQIKEEIAGCLDFLKAVYDVFGFTFKLYLSTRPEKYMGEIEIWNTAEKQLSESLDAFGYKWEINPGDGAFYGPKIDIIIMDALRRPHQCATIQLDFQLPIRFDLNYVSGGEDGEKKRPVMIHRAILGSVERMIAILCENYGGKWPFWLSPRQCIVVPVAPPFNEYANQVRQQLHDAGFMCEADVDDGNTLNKKVRNAQIAQFNFILVVGEKELENKTANVRTRCTKVHGEHSIADIITKFSKFKATRCLDAEDKFE